jgi:hypothetical protein
MAVGSSMYRPGSVDLMTHTLDIYGRADASSVLGPVARSLVAAEKGQDRQ